MWIFWMCLYIYSIYITSNILAVTQWDNWGMSRVTNIYIPEITCMIYINIFLTYTTNNFELSAVVLKCQYLI